MDDQVLMAEVRLKLDHLQEGVDEIKTDVRDLKDGAPLLRIQQLEAWRSNVTKVIIGMILAVIGAWAGILATLVIG